MAKRVFTIKETGLRFKVGYSLRPKWDDLRAVLLYLQNKGKVGADLFPYLDGGIENTTKDTIHELVPEMLFNAGQYYKHYREPIKACLWVIAWYNHIWLSGPRPNVVKRARRLRSLPTAIFKCPMCGEHWFAPRRLRTQGAALTAFSKWLVTHSRAKYHDDKITGRLPYLYQGEVQGKESVK